jgi:hypothetical protein
MRLTTRQLFSIVLLLAIFIISLRPIADPDFWWHLRTGQLIYETGQIPKSDPFSFTAAGKPWIAHEWLSELIIYALYRLGGFGLLTFVFSSLITIAFLLVYLRSPERPFVAGFALLLSALATAPTWGVRPQMISLLLTSLFLYLLDGYQTSRRIGYLLPLPVITLLWVNLHAGFALGLGIIGIYILGEGFEFLVQFLAREKPVSTPQLRQTLWLIGTLAACLLAAIVNPNGLKLYLYPFQTLTSPSMQQFIQEWFSPDFHLSEWQPLAWMILALMGFGLLSRKASSPTWIMLTLVFGYAGLISMRNVPLFAIAAAPVLSEQIGALVQIEPGRPLNGRLLTWLNPLALAIVLLAAGLRFGSVVGGQTETEQTKFPVQAVNWILQNHPAGRLFNSYGWGGYLIWRMYPQYPVYIDGRADLYGDQFIYSYLSLYNAEPGWGDKLAAQNVGIILVEPNAPLANALQLSPDWAVAFRDKSSVLYIRNR